ncbi:MAG: hypothetical protein HYS26_00685 [Candidatus Kaiserbacteria bacterium]|nr:MAG: hypothetical protein HYS26_00685 [Candidatus Kaiserbacteria bacterium]
MLFYKPTTILVGLQKISRRVSAYLYGTMQACFFYYFLQTDHQFVRTAKTVKPLFPSRPLGWSVCKDALSVRQSIIFYKNLPVLALVFEVRLAPEVFE